MSKINIKTTILSNQERCEENYIAIYNKNSYLYQEKECQVKLTFQDEVCLQRENDLFLLILPLDTKKRTHGKYILKKEHVELDLEIETDYIIRTENLIKIHYQIPENELNVTYIIEVGGKV